MAITRLKRKGRKNKLRAKVRADKMKLEGFKPVIKQVDIEAIKEGFDKAGKKPAVAAKEVKVEKVEKAVEAKAEQPAAEVAEPAKAPAKKKAAAKPKAEKKEAKEEKKPAKKKATPKAKAEKKDEE